jgi:small-conductance mechanosensitive channel
MVEDNTFTKLLTTVWTSLDDILLCAGILLVSIPLLTACSHGLHSYFKSSVYVSQSINFVAVAVVLVFLLGHLVGEKVAISLFGGFSVGVGYALQPYIVSLLSGATYYSTNMICEGDEIVVDKKKYRVIDNGILYILAKDVNENMMVYLPNAMFQNRPLICHKN